MIFTHGSAIHFLITAEQEEDGRTQFDTICPSINVSGKFLAHRAILGRAHTGRWMYRLAQLNPGESNVLILKRRRLHSQRPKCLSVKQSPSHLSQTPKACSLPLLASFHSNVQASQYLHLFLRTLMLIPLFDSPLLI